jgi:predicted Zn-dependent protease
MGKRATFTVMIAIVTVLAAASRLPAQDGVKIAPSSAISKVVSADKLEQRAAEEFRRQKEMARSANTLLPDAHSDVVRVWRLVKELLPHAGKFNERANVWKWDVIVLDEDIINAFCAPGGKITVYTGIIRELQLTDDELAVLVGHEIAHALRDHSRGDLARSALSKVAAEAVATMTGVDKKLALQGAQLSVLQAMRKTEIEADLIGLELSARSGHDPRAGLTFWEKMRNLGGDKPPQWLSTHPSDEIRLQVMKENMHDVLPLYEATVAARDKN